MTIVVLTGLLMAVGLVGIVVPVLPGLALVAASTALWAALHHDGRTWIVVAVCAVLYGVGLVTQYVVPGRRLRSAGVGTPTLMLAVVLGIVGFFVVPVVGALLGFVVGIFLVELRRRRSAGLAWTSTKHALRAVGLSMGIELTTGLVIVVVFGIGVATLGAS